MDALPPSPPPSFSISLPPTSISSLDPSHHSLSKSSTKSDSRPLSLLPTELKREILRFCDPSTLAKTSSLSLAFLQLSSPLLYDEIEIIGFEDVARLFCPRHSSHQPQLEPYLSLTRIISLTFTASPMDHLSPTPLLLRDRVKSDHVAVEVESLTLRARPLSRPLDAWRSLTPLFDARSVHFIGLLDPSGAGLLPSIELPSNAIWSNLCLLCLEDCEGAGRENWACLRGTSRSVTIILILRTVASRDCITPILRSVLPALTKVEKVVVRLPTEEWCRDVKAIVERTWMRAGLVEREVGRRKDLVQYEAIKKEEA